MDRSTHHTHEAGHCLQCGQLFDGLKGHGKELGRSHVGDDRQSIDRALHTHEGTCSSAEDRAVLMAAMGSGVFYGLGCFHIGGLVKVACVAFA